ncbi:MAG: Rieske (2Fe-2S) protein [Gemmatimonadaceae bacterium]|nr:Rieske (2Fe-2S) protein [Gemmatimonadaceae bacterium]
MRKSRVAFEENLSRLAATVSDAPSRCSRRDAIAVVARSTIMCAGFALGGCASDRTAATAPIASPDAVTVTDTEIVVDLTRVAKPPAVGEALVFGELQLMVIRVNTRDYRAFSNVCTHAACGIYEFSALRMRCGCHGSEFDISGTNVAGPAPSPLTQYATVVDADLRTLRIARRAL